jgi:hypothetical protein
MDRSGGLSKLNKKGIIGIIIILFVVAAIFDLMNQGLGYSILPQFLKDIVDSIFNN